MTDPNPQTPEARTPRPRAGRPALAASRTSSGARSPTSAACSASCPRSSSGSSSRIAARSPNTEAKEALNFQITIVFGYLLSLILLVVFIGALLWWAVWIVSVVFSIIAFLRAKDGNHYRYPFAIRLIK